MGKAKTAIIIVVLAALIGGIISIFPIRQRHRKKQRSVQYRM